MFSYTSIIREIEALNALINEVAPGTFKTQTQTSTTTQSFRWESDEDGGGEFTLDLPGKSKEDVTVKYLKAKSVLSVAVKGETRTPTEYAIPKGLLLDFAEMVNGQLKVGFYSEDPADESEDVVVE
jgi:hypothetical protein